MTSEKHAFLMPWDKPPDEPESPAERSLADTVAAIQADIAFAVQHTAVLVRSSNEALRTVANTERGQLTPPGFVTFTDGSTVEFQDIGMPQPGAPLMTVHELVKACFAKAIELGLEIA